MGRLVMQFGGRGRLEEHPPGVVDGARFEGRFLIWALSDGDGPVFGPDVSLFDATLVEKLGRGPQSAHLVAVRSGITMEGFVTDEGDFLGHVYGRTSTDTRLRIFFDANPDGSRHFDDRAAFMQGELVATYEAEEFFQINPRSGTFDTRVNYSIMSSKPFTFQGKTVDLGTMYPRMFESSNGHNPEPDPNPEVIPNEAPFDKKGPGTFANRFPVGGSLFAV